LYRKAYERCVALGEEALDKPHLKYEILYHLGCMYINGWGVIQNGHTGRCLVFKAAEKNETAKKYCSQFLSMTNEEWYQRLQEDVKNLDIDSLFEGGSPALEFGKTNRNTNKQNVDVSTQDGDEAEDKPVVIIDEHDIFDPMAIFLDPNAKIEIREYNGEDDYDSDGKDGDPFKADRRSPKLRLDPLTKDKIDEIFTPLDQLVGLGHIKQEVRSIVNLVQLNRMRVTKGLPEIPVGMHMVFAGPPGTGKTTVARLIGDILWEIGYLDSGHVIDVSRHDIVGEYVGWTASMTSKALKAAKGGIFFLDEAYMLSNSESANDFGQEAIDTINKYMEDNRGDMLVIAAGYKDEMVNFMISNPGLKSRFKHELDFKPMDNEQLYAVYEQFCKQYELNLDEEATSLLHKVLHRAHRLGEFHKSNARGVRDMFERMLVKQAQRLAEEGFDLENADLQTIVKQDIYVPETINDGYVTFLSSKKDD
jgi:AAA+ superfamily predicted ATPase